MIGRLHGIILEKQAPILLLDVSGVGYIVNSPMTTFYSLPEVGKEITLFTHLSVREDEHTLFGFLQKQELKLFRDLIKVNGVGPRLALTILSGVEPNNFVQCVLNNDVASLVKLPGIGKKTAERLLIDMRDKLKDWGYADTAKVGDLGGAAQDAISALMSLGYKQNDAQRAIAKLKGKNLTSEELIRLSLKEI